MPTLLVAYDIARRPDQAADLTRTIRSLARRWARPLASVWYLETDATVADVEATLASFLDGDDALVVHEVTGNAALLNTVARWTTGERAIRWWQPRLVQPSTNLPHSEPRVATAA